MKAELYYKGLGGYKVTVQFKKGQFKSIELDFEKQTEQGKGYIAGIFDCIDNLDFDKTKTNLIKYGFEELQAVQKRIGNQNLSDWLRVYKEEMKVAYPTPTTGEAAAIFKLDTDEHFDKIVKCFLKSKQWYASKKDIWTFVKSFAAIKADAYKEIEQGKEVVIGGHKLSELRKRFGDGWSKTMEKEAGDELTLYWTYLREIGYIPIKINGQTSHWEKTNGN